MSLFHINFTQAATNAYASVNIIDNSIEERVESCNDG